MKCVCQVMRPFLIPAMVILVLLAPTLAAQQDTCGPRNIFVRVEDDKGQPVTGLTKHEFTALMGKEEIPITSVETAPPLNRIALLLDRSASMHDEFKQKVMIGTAASLVEKSSVDTQFFWMTFADLPSVEESFTLDHDRLSNEIRQFGNGTPWKGPTAIFDAIRTSVVTVFRAGDVDSAIVLISDGGDDVSHITRADTEWLVANSGIRLFLVQLISPTEKDLGPMQRREGRVLEEIIQYAGGELFRLGRHYPSKLTHSRPFSFRVEKGYGNLPEIASEILGKMSAGYLLRLSLPSAVGKVEGLKVEVSRANSQKPQKLSVFYPEKLFPCAATSLNH